MSLNLEVGKTYLDTLGRVIKIIKYNVRNNTYQGDNLNRYDVNGNLNTSLFRGPYDLFTEHNPEDL